MGKATGASIRNRGLTSLTVFLCGHFALSNTLADVYSCKDPSGKTIFTDNKSSCASGFTRIPVKKTNDARVNYRYPTRNYIEKKSPYPIFVESPESDVDARQLESANQRLIETLDSVYRKLPSASHEYLKLISFYIMIGPRSKNGGESNGLRYYVKSGDSQLLLGDKRWANAIVIFNVEDFLSASDLWIRKVLTHELSHAWHYKNWDQNYPKLRDAWLSARNRGLYLSQKGLDGSLRQPAYASTNEREYFAELSAIYFVGGDYYPFGREELKQYDPVGFATVEDVWGLRPDATRASQKSGSE